MLWYSCVPGNSGSARSDCKSAAVIFTQVSKVGDARKQYAGYSLLGRAVGVVDMSCCDVVDEGGMKASGTRRDKCGHACSRALSACTELRHLTSKAG